MTRFLVCLTIVPLAFSRTLLCSETSWFFDATTQTIRRRIAYDPVVLNGIRDVLGKPNDQGDFVCNGMMVHVRYANDDDYKHHSFINPPVIIPIVSGLPWQKKGEILILRTPARCLRYIYPGGVAYITSYDLCSPIKAMKARIAASTLKNSGWFANALRHRRQEVVDVQALQATSHEDLKTYLDHAQRCPSELVHSAVFVQRAQKLLTQRNRCLESVARKALWKVPKGLQDHALTFLRKKN